MTPGNMWRMWEVTCLLWGYSCLSRKKCKHSHISGKRSPNSDRSKSIQRRANMSHEFRHRNRLPMSDTRSWLCVWCHKSVWEVERRRGEGISETRTCGKPKANERTLRGREDNDRKRNRKRRTSVECLMQSVWDADLASKQRCVELDTICLYKIEPIWPEDESTFAWPAFANL